MSDLASWIASGATTLAAVMTAANLGTRITGWGFVMFALASLVWGWVGITDDQTGLAVTNAVLLIINLFGAWRWLGRQARHEHGSAVATERSRSRGAVSTLFSGAAIGRLSRRMDLPDPAHSPQASADPDSRVCICGSVSLGRQRRARI